MTNNQSVFFGKYNTFVNDIINKIKNGSRVDWINWIILLYAFSLTLPQALRILFATILVILWVTDKTKPILPKIKIIIILFIMFISLNLISVIWSKMPIIDVIMYTKKYLYYAPLFVIYRYLKKDYISLSLSFFLAGLFISEILSYGNFFNLWQIGRGSSDDPNVFLHHSHYSVFLSIGIFILFLKIKETTELKVKIFLGLFLFAMLTNLFINGGRTGQFAFLATLLLYFIFYKKNYKLAIGGFVFAWVVLFGYYNISPVFKHRMELISSDITKAQDGNFTSSIGGRIGFYIVAKDVIKKSPILGEGAAKHMQTIRLIIKQKYPQLEYTSSLIHAHNYYLEIIFTIGILGLSIFIYLIYKISSIPIRSENINSLKFITLTIFLLSGLVTALFYSQSTISLFSYIIGVVFAKYRLEDQKNNLF